MYTRSTPGLVIAFFALSLAAYGQQSPAPDFIPDYTFEGAQLAGWRSLGDASWGAENGQITGEATSEGGGWLLFDEAYENVAVYSRFRCDGPCDAGILLRAEEAADGMKGILVALEGETVAPYRVMMDKNGQILTRSSARGPQGGVPPGDDQPTSAVLEEAIDSLTAPVLIRPDRWNSIEIFIDGNSISNHLNNVRNALRGGTAQILPANREIFTGGYIVPTDNTVYGYGPVALYVGSGRVVFDDVSVKNLLVKEIEPEKTSSRFRVQRVNPFTYAWGADVADINNDGQPDLISGPFYYLGPEFRVQHEFYTARVFNPGEEYVNDMITFANDWTGDGWVDVLNTERRPLVMYVNPKGEKRLWERVEVLPDVCSETAIRADVDGDGQPEVAFIGSDGRVAYGEPDPDDRMGPWLIHQISEPVIQGCNSHGLGTGDVDGDGRVDLLQARGWWEQPDEGPDKGLWIYHDDWFGRLTRSPQHPGGAEIAVYDFNGDGLNDVVSSLSAHGWGLAWYEQVRDADGAISFNEHLIMGDFSTKNAGGVTFSQPHSGATLGDIDHDGVMDFVTGKRHWSHLDSYSDPDPYGEAVIYWYRTVRDPQAPGGVRFEPELIHNKSGVGSEVKVLDINGDGALDIATAGSHGTFLIWGVPGH